MSEELKILEDYLEQVHQRTDGNCPICGAEDYPVSGDKKGYEEVPAGEADEYHCDHYEDCAVTVIENFIAALNTRPEQGRDELLEALKNVCRSDEIMEARRIARECLERAKPLAKCKVCGKSKCPAGRSAPIPMRGNLCDHDCEGYMQEPYPDSLWPNEEAE